MADTPDLRSLSDDELTEMFREAEARHREIRATEPSALAIIDPDDPAVLTDAMRDAADTPWKIMQAVALERDRRRTTQNKTAS